MKKLTAVILAFATMFLIFSPVALASNDACNLMVNKSVVCEKNNSDLKSVAKNVINVLFWVVGVAAVIVIIYSGLQYILSTGDSGKVQKAKNTIVYAVVGLIVAILSYAIVGFVIDSLS